MDDKPMEEKQHVTVVPGEAKPPDVVPAPVHMEPGGHVQSDDINVGMVAVIGTFAAVGLFLIVVLLQAWFYSWVEVERQQKAANPSDPGNVLAQVEAEQRRQLASYHWVKQEAGVRAIPIDRAMDLVADELSARQRDNGVPTSGHR